MNDARNRFLVWTSCLLDPSRTPLEQLRAAQAWCAWGLALLGIDERTSTSQSSAFHTDTGLETGKAISPFSAAICVREYRRTAVFLQAMQAAIKAAQERHPGEIIHVVEAGCGPLAPLAFAMAAHFPVDQVSFTLLDLHPASLAGARRVAEELGLTRSVRAYLEADVTKMRFPEAERPHVIACEVLLRALTREPQVAATLNLAPQLRADGFFLPECIDVDAVLFDSDEYFRPAMTPEEFDARRATGVKELGNVFSLEAASLDKLKHRGERSLEAATISVPPFGAGNWEFQLFTRIRVFREHVLNDFESSLNMSQPVRLPKQIIENGGEARFVYEMSSDPGLTLVE